MAEYYVSTTGSSGNPGSQGSPWSLAHAIGGAGGVIQPGDTIWMRGGTYTQAASWVWTVSGTLGVDVNDPATKVKFRNFVGELVSITNTNAATECCVFDSSYLWLWATLGQAEGIEIWRNVTERSLNRGTNIWYRATPQNGNKMLHVVSRDGANGVFCGNGAGTSYDVGDLEIYGNIVFNQGEDTSPRQHGMYVRHHDTNGRILRVQGNIVFNTLGNGVQVFGNAGNNGMKNIEVLENILFGAGVLGTAASGSTWMNAHAGAGTSPIEGGKFNRNVMFQVGNSADEGNGYLGVSGATNKDLEAQDNYVVGGFNDHGIRLSAFPIDGSASLKFDRNVIIPRGASRPLRTQQAGVLSAYTSWTENDYRRDPTATGWSHAGVSKTFAQWKTDTGLGASDVASASNPTVNKVFVYKVDRYNPGYAIACFFNWESSATVGVDLTLAGIAPGDSYAIHNAQDIFGAPVLSGTYAGGLVQFPTTGKLPPTPVGTTPRTAPTTAPFFDAFFIKRTAVGAGSGRTRHITVIDHLTQIAA